MEGISLLGSSEARVGQKVRIISKNIRGHVVAVLTTGEIVVEVPRGYDLCDPEDLEPL
jgi:hypothetical protein